MYPTDFEPEQPEQDRMTAPFARTLVLASASGVVSLGPVVHVPQAISRIQFTSLCFKALERGVLGNFGVLPMLQLFRKWLEEARRRWMS